MNSRRLLTTLQRHEGLRLKPYTDTAGVLTIGYGHNLADGIDEEMANYILRRDLLEAQYAAAHAVRCFHRLDDVRQEALVNMAFNLGGPRLAKFKRMLAALEAQDWDQAAAEALDSKWATQVGARAKEIAEQLRTGTVNHD